MSGLERRIGRWACAVGTIAGLAYLLWRAGRSLVGTSPFVSLPALVVEVVGVLATTLLAWALWTRPEPRWVPGLDRVTGLVAAELTDAGPVAVMISSDRRDLPWLRATVLAARPLGPITIVDVAHRDDVRDFARDLGLGYLATEPDDLNGLAAFAAVCTTPAFLQLDAGDVPHPAILDRLRPHLRADVAIVQAVGAASSDDSAEHSQTGRHVRDVERRAINPALGVRGVAMYLGSGALVRAAAMRETEPGTASPQMAHARVTAALFEAGQRIVVPGSDPLVALDPILVANDAEAARACEASAARALLVGQLGALRVNRLSLDQRLAMLTWSIRPLAGIRRTIVVALIVDALLSGRMPMVFSASAMCATWLPWIVCSTVGLFFLSGRRLRPGDRGRSAFRALGTSWRGLTTPNGRPEQPRRIVGGAFGLHHSVAPTVAVTVISVVLGLRGLSDRFTHTLETIGGREMAALLTVSLCSLWSALDALRLLARRTQSRRARRVAASLPCTMLDHAALIVDLTALGAGILSDVEVHPGETLRVDVVLPTASGCTTARIDGVVRNVRLDFSGGHRLGVQFGQVDAYVADTLAEYCILQPGLEVLGTAPEIDRSEARPIVVVDAQPGGSRRLGLRAAALVAVAGALASAAPRSAEASSVAATVHGRVATAQRAADGALVLATPVVGAVALAVCAAGPGADATFGTSDDLYLAPRTVVTGADGGYDVPALGEACWVSISLPPGYLSLTATGELARASVPAVVEMVDHRAPEVHATHASGGTDGTVSRPITLTDAVFIDLDGDGLRGTAEPGVSGVTITIYAVDGSVLQRTTTGSGGSFTYVVADGDTYRVGVSELPDGWFASTPDGVSVLRSAVIDDAASGDTPGGIALGDAGISALAPRVSDVLVPPATITTRLYPAPRPADLAGETPTGIPSGVAALIIAIAALLAVSVLVGSLLPFRRGSSLSSGEWDDGLDDWGGGWGTGGRGIGQSSSDLAIR